MSRYRVLTDPRAELDLDAAAEWYDGERAGLGLEFLEQVRATLRRIADGPLKYQDLRSGIRRALVRRFPYAVYFFIESDAAWVVAVLHVARDPAEWQRRGLYPSGPP